MSFCSCTLFKIRAGNWAWIELCNFKCNWHLQKKRSSTIDSRNAQVKATLGNFIIIETVITTLLIWIPLKIHVFGLQQSYLKRVSTVSLLWALISSDKLQRTKVIDFIKETKLNIKIMEKLEKSWEALKIKHDSWYLPVYKMHWHHIGKMARTKYLWTQAELFIIITFWTTGEALHDSQFKNLVHPPPETSRSKQQVGGDWLLTDRTVWPY